MADKIPIPKAGPAEAPLIRTTEPRKIIRTDSDQSNDSVVKHRIATKEPTFSEKLKRSFVNEDFKSIRDYVVFDVLIPNFKRSVFDMAMGALGQTLGIQVPRYQNSPFSNNRQSSGYKDYTAISSRSRDPIRERNEIRYDRLQIRDLVFESKAEALSILELMTDICDTNRVVSVFTFYEKAGIREGNPYTNKNWGWRNLNDVGVASVEYPNFPDGIGYVIDFPPAKPI